MKISRKMKKKIDAYKNEFLNQVSYECIRDADNGTFIGVGTLREPEDHIIRGINTMCLYIVAPNKDGTDIASERLSMTDDEAYILTCLISAALSKKPNIN